MLTRNDPNGSTVKNKLYRTFASHLIFDADPSFPGSLSASAQGQVSLPLVFDLHFIKLYLSYSSGDNRGSKVPSTDYIGFDVCIRFSQKIAKMGEIMRCEVSYNYFITSL